MTEETHFIKRYDGRGEAGEAVYYWPQIEPHPYTRGDVIDDVISGNIEGDDAVWCAYESGSFNDASYWIAGWALNKLCKTQPISSVDDIPAFILAHAPDLVEHHFREQASELREQRVLSSREYVGTV